MDKKTIIIAVILGAIIIFYYPILEFLGLYQAPEAPPQRTQTTEVDTVTPGAAQSPEPRIDDLQEMPGKQSVRDTAMAALPDTFSVDTIAVETERYRILLSNRGGGPISIELKEYEYNGNAQVEMLPESDLATPDARFAGGTYSTSQLPYQASLRPGSYDALRDTLELTYRYENPGGGSIRKTYIFYPDEYHYDLTFSVENTRALGFERSYTLWWNTPLGVSELQAKSDYDAMQAVAMQGGSRETLDDFSDNRLNQSLDGYTTWVGVRNKFFTSIIIPRSREGQAAVADGFKQDVALPDGKVETRRITAGVVMPFAGVENITDSFTVYVGPLDYLRMSDYKVDLEAMLDIGTMPYVGWILKPFAWMIMWLLPRLYDIVPNYGIVIILFAILVKLLTLPLSMKQYKSMQGMRDIAPKLEELKNRHKKDPQALQRETMKLYKEHGVNPMSGCLVMLPQMPLMIAMFRVFQSTVLLRNEPFVWFIDDLSRGASGFFDPLIILVIFMVATQLLSSIITMSSGPSQQKAFIYIFPLVLGFLLYSLPSGLILYWSAFSLLSLVDYFAFKRNKTKNPQVKTA